MVPCCAYLAVSYGAICSLSWSCCINRIMLSIIHAIYTSMYQSILSCPILSYLTLSYPTCILSHPTCTQHNPILSYAYPVLRPLLIARLYYALCVTMSYVLHVPILTYLILCAVYRVSIYQPTKLSYLSYRHAYLSHRICKLSYRSYLSYHMVPYRH